MIFLSWAAIAVLGIAWLAGSLAWYVAFPLIILFLWQVISSKTQAPKPESFSELPATFKFTYIDRDGGSSTRTVDVQAISQRDGSTYLEGFCHKRQEDRTFRTDRIVGRLTNVGTGEILDASDLLLSVRERSSMDFRPDAKYLNKFN